MYGTVVTARLKTITLAFVGHFKDLLAVTILYRDVAKVAAKSRHTRGVVLALLAA